MSVGAVLNVTGLMIAPTAAVGAVLHAPQIAKAVRRVVVRRQARQPQPAPVPIEELAARLRRLLGEHDALMRTPNAAFRVHHLRALEAAVGDCAFEAAAALGIRASNAPSSAHLAPADIGALLRSLAKAGLVLPTRSELLLAGLTH